MTRGPNFASRSSTGPAATQLNSVGGAHETKVVTSDSSSGASSEWNRSSTRSYAHSRRSEKVPASMRLRPNSKYACNNSISHLGVILVARGLPPPRREPRSAGSLPPDRAARLWSSGAARSHHEVRRLQGDRIEVAISLRPNMIPIRRRPTAEAVAGLDCKSLSAGRIPVCQPQTSHS